MSNPQILNDLCYNKYALVNYSGIPYRHFASTHIDTPVTQQNYFAGKPYVQRIPHKLNRTIVRSGPHECSNPNRLAAHNVKLDGYANY
jgi:hypothetical protein